MSVISCQQISCKKKKKKKQISELHFTKRLGLGQSFFFFFFIFWFTDFFIFFEKSSYGGGNKNKNKKPSTIESMKIKYFEQD